MRIPNVQQPSWDEISRELETYKCRESAWLRNERPLPPLPAPVIPPSASGIRFCWGLGSRAFLLGVARLGAAIGSAHLRLWSARQRIRTDKYWYEPATCSLNTAFTDLGLALLELGDVPAAVESLRRSWHVHPCPHNTSFGLSDRLWKALEFAPEANEARAEYEAVARRFQASFGAQRERRTRIQTVRLVAKTLWEWR